MLGTGLLVFREVLEAALIISIVCAATRGVPARGRWVVGGIGLGIVGALLVAFFADTLASAISGIGQELFNAAVLLAAGVMIAWHAIWMASHGRELATQMKAVGGAVTSGSRPLSALLIVIAIAVLREGSEVVLFLYGIFAQGTSGLSLLSGGVLGIVAGAAFTALTYAGLLAIPQRYIFSVTSWLIALLAAGMAAQSAQFLYNAGVIDRMGETVWDSSWLLSEKSLFGQLMHTLIGYVSQPTALQIVAYIGTLAAMYVLMRIPRYRHEPRPVRV